MKQLFCNIDDTVFFKTPFGSAPVCSAEVLTQLVACLGQAGVTDLVICVNAQRTVYRSAVWQSYWDGYQPEAGDDQPFLKALPEQRLRSDRPIIHRMLQMHESGVDYPAVMIAEAKKHGMRAWISVRMNDVHDGAFNDYPCHDAFHRENLSLRLHGCLPYFNHGLDYAHASVRAHMLALIRELLERYEMDGLELDFLREPFLFSRGEEAAGRAILSSWLRGEILPLVRQTSARGNQTVALGVRVPSEPDVATALGIDAVDWAQQGDVDVVVPAPRWASLQYDVPIREWKQRIHNDRVRVVGGAEVREQDYPDGPWSMISPAALRGVASAMLSQEADGVYLFNIFPMQHPGWEIAEYCSTLRELTAPEAILRHGAHYAITFRDITGPEEHYQAPLPATGSAFTLPLPVGFLPHGEGIGILRIHLREGDPHGVLATLNGHSCTGLSCRATANGTTIECTVSAEKLHQGIRNELCLSTATGENLLVDRITLDLLPQTI